MGDNCLVLSSVGSKMKHEPWILSSGCLESKLEEQLHEHEQNREQRALFYLPSLSLGSERGAGQRSTGRGENIHIRWEGRGGRGEGPVSWGHRMKM